MPIRVTSEGLKRGMDAANPLASMSALPTHRATHTEIARFQIRGCDIQVGLVQRGEAVDVEFRLNSDDPNREGRVRYRVPMDQDPSGPKTARLAGTHISLVDKAYGCLRLTISTSKHPDGIPIRVWNKPGAPDSTAGISLPQGTFDQVV